MNCPPLDHSSQPLSASSPFEALSPMIRVLTGSRRENTVTRRGNDHMETQAEIRVLQPHKEKLSPSESGRDKESLP